MENETPEQIAQHFKAMGDSVWLINAVIAGEEMADASQEDKANCVERNVDHLELMKDKEFWTDQDFTEVIAAIAAGKAYIS